MPIVRIEERGKPAAAEKERMVAVVYGALKSTLGVTDDELQARYVCYADDEFYAPAGHDGAYLTIEISLFHGRSAQAKRALYAHMVRDVAALRRMDPAGILVLLREEPRENWGMRGGQAATDIDFPYRISV
jgi:phenylpyruvate tautomerase PptA (4-oxalocrotonate tautomerase family)